MSIRSVKTAATRGVEGLCLEVHDLAIAKYVAGRDKDRRYTCELARRGMIDRRVLLTRLDTTQVVVAVRRLVRARIDQDFGVRR